MRFDEAAVRALKTRPAEYGQELSRVLFADAEVERLFRAARDHATANNLPLRIRLSLGPGTEALHGFRWELLRDPEHATGLADSDRIYFSRYLSSTEWRAAGELANPPRVLLAVSRPTGLDAWGLKEFDDSDVMAEVRRIVDAFGGERTARFTTLAARGTVTLANLVRSLRDGCDICYVVCHGLAEGPLLLLETETGEVARVMLDPFVEGFRQLQDVPRLVVLASCQSARVGRSQDGGALSAFGPARGQGGCPRRRGDAGQRVREHRRRVRAGVL